MEGSKENGFLEKCLPLGDGVFGWRGLTISNPGDILLKKNIYGDANEGFH